MYPVTFFSLKLNIFHKTKQQQKRNMASHASLSPAFVDKIDPFKKGSLKRKQKRSQGSSRYRITSEIELQPLPLLKGMFVYVSNKIQIN